MLGIDLSADGAGHIFQSLQSQPGAPTNGLNYVGDSIRDSNGALWLCTSTGMSGTWVQVATLPDGVIGGVVVYLSHPIRLLDTRKGTTSTSAHQIPQTPLNGGESYPVNVADVSFNNGSGTVTVPTGAVSALGNLTAVTPSSAGYLAVVPHGAGFQGTSNVNYTAGVVVPNFFTVNLNDGNLDIYVDRNSAPVDVLLDLFAVIL